MSRTPRTSHRRRACRPAVAALLIMFVTAPAVAAKIYRCGNVFQDLPCPEQKVADARPVETGRIARDSTPCAADAKDAAGRNERSDCSSRAREPQSVSRTDMKSR